MFYPSYIYFTVVDLSMNLDAFMLKGSFCVNMFFPETVVAASVALRQAETGGTAAVNCDLRK